MPGDVHTRRLLHMLFAGSRGGIVRIKIISYLRDKPLNTNQIASSLGVDYKTAQHHLRVLERNTMVVRADDRYGATYSISTLLDVNIESFDDLIRELEKSK